MPSPNWSSVRQLFNGVLLAKRERAFVNVVQDHLTPEVLATGTLSTDWKVGVAEIVWPSLARMKDGKKKEHHALASYDNMLARPNIREALKASFDAVGFTENVAAQSLANLASGKAKTVVTVVRDGEHGFTETRVTQHPPNMGALKQYYDLTHEPPTQRHEHLNVNVDVMKENEPLNVTPRAVGDLGPAENGAINVFAEPDEDEGKEEDDEQEDEPS